MPLYFRQPEEPPALLFPSLWQMSGEIRQNSHAVSKLHYFDLYNCFSLTCPVNVLRKLPYIRQKLCKTCFFHYSCLKKKKSHGNQMSSLSYSGASRVRCYCSRAFLVKVLLLSICSFLVLLPVICWCSDGLWCRCNIIGAVWCWCYLCHCSGAP